MDYIIFWKTEMKNQDFLPDSEEAYVFHIEILMNSIK